MAATLRELRGRIRSAGSIKKITKAQELIATSRIAKAQARVAGGSALLHRDHQHAHRAGGCQRAGPPAAGRAGVTQAGRRAGRVLRPWAVRRLQRQRAAAAEELFALLREEGKEPGDLRRRSKGAGLLQLPSAATWPSRGPASPSGRPTSTPREIADTLVTAFMSGADDDGDDAGDDGILGVDEIHIVFTEFKSMLSQSADGPADRADGGRVRRRRRAGRRSADAVLVRARTPRRCSTRCCRATSRPASTRRCWRPRPPSRRRADAR